MDFLGLAASCGPSVHPVTTAAIVKAESAYNPLAVRDNTLSITFRPTTLATARVIVDEQIKAGHQLVIGLMQVRSTWAAKFGLSATELLNACTNIRVGTALLTANYRECAVPGRAPKSILECALSLYWSGRDHIGGAYINQVYRLAGSPERVPETPGVTDGLLGSRTIHFPVIPAVRQFRIHAPTFSFSDRR